MNGAWVCPLAVLGGLVGLVVLVTFARRHRARRKAAAPRGPRRIAPRVDPRRIEVGDIVEIGDVAYPVRGSVRLVEGEWRWAEHLLDDPDGRRRLSVAENPEFELVLWRPEPGRAGTPGAPVVEFAGRSYDWRESGQARYTATGATGLPPSGTMRYHDYRATGGVRLTFEAYGETGWEMAQGERLEPAEVVVHPQGR
ncbi:DUF4178 domain-containing protein [Micromonospora radicis]|uniref:DUF4178 domain-containing protein n=1 Tax=Micromonospora radicis TaxID=1894971 RepID=A0A418MVX5_9ACTN|nr:DUF4178 domain-containing protein [Micromonospora radicis]RIV38928.1 DUF4178 domain-containing protein [Micromonospora radicis]